MTIKKATRKCNCLRDCKRRACHISKKKKKIKEWDRKDYLEVLQICATTLTIITLAAVVYNYVPKASTVQQPTGRRMGR